MLPPVDPVCVGASDGAPRCLPAFPSLLGVDGCAPPVLGFEADLRTPLRLPSSLRTAATAASAGARAQAPTAASAPPPAAAGARRLAALDCLLAAPGAGRLSSALLPGLLLPSCGGASAALRPSAAAAFLPEPLG